MQIQPTEPFYPPWRQVGWEDLELEGKDDDESNAGEKERESFLLEPMRTGVLRMWIDRSSMRLRQSGVFGQQQEEGVGRYRTGSTTHKACRAGVCFEVMMMMMMTKMIVYSGPQ